MTSWKVYILCATILPLAETQNSQGRYKLETTATPNQQEPLGHVEILEEHKIKVGNRIEPVIFEPQRKIKLSRSTYKVTSYVDFKPYKQSFKQFGQYIDKFLIIYVTQIILAPYIMWISLRESPQSGEVQEQDSSLQELLVGKQPTGAEFKISFYNLKGKQQKLIKFIGKPIRNS